MLSCNVIIAKMKGHKIESLESKYKSDCEMFTHLYRTTLREPKKGDEIMIGRAKRKVVDVKSNDKSIILIIEE
jgi:hypothetical protein